MSQTITLGLVDDEALFVQGLAAVLNQQPQLSVTLTANSGPELLDALKAAATAPDVLIIDLRMKPLSGIETVEALREVYPDARVAILTTHYRDAYIGYMMKLGVSAFLPKDINPADLVVAIEAIAAKGVYFTETQMLRLQSQMASGRAYQTPELSDEPLLTKRELEVLKLLCEQKTSAEIAEKLFVSIRTVHGHRNNLLLKTGAKNTVGLVMYALLNRVVELPDRWDGVV